MKNKLKILSVFILVGGLIFFVARPAQTLTMYQFDPGENWQKDSDPYGVIDEGWTLKESPDVTLSVMGHGNSDLSKLISKSNLEKSIRDFTRGRKAVLHIQKIDDWKIKDYSFTEEAGVKRLYLTGSYTDSGGHRVSYQEAHHFAGHDYYVLTLIYPEGSKFEKEGSGESLLKQFHVASRAGVQL